MGMRKAHDTNQPWLYEVIKEMAARHEPLEADEPLWYDEEIEVPSCDLCGGPHTPDYNCPVWLAMNTA